MRERIAIIREVETQVRTAPIGILADLQGPKLRVGEFADGGVELEKGADASSLDADKTPGDADRVHLPHPEILRALEPGHSVLIDDGKMRLHVSRREPEARHHARRGRRPHLEPQGREPARHDHPRLRDDATKDRSDLEAALRRRRRLGRAVLRAAPRGRGRGAQDRRADGRCVMSKIEKPQAIARLDEIIEISDALMVARGDLGVEMPLEKVPGLQKRITRSARRLGKPVVVATQMLESMITSPVPTRAEVSDVATAVYRRRRRGHAVGRMRRGTIPGRGGRHHEPHRGGGGGRRQIYRAIIIAAAQRAGGHRRRRHRRRRAPRRRDAGPEGHLRVDVVGLDGACASRASARSPPVLALTPNRDTARRLTLVWGVQPIVTNDAQRHRATWPSAPGKFSNRVTFAKEGERIIIVAGVPVRHAGRDEHGAHRVHGIGELGPGARDRRARIHPTTAATIPAGTAIKGPRMKMTPIDAPPSRSR